MKIGTKSSLTMEKDRESESESRIEIDLHAPFAFPMILNMARTNQAKPV